MAESTNLPPTEPLSLPPPPTAPVPPLPSMADPEVPVVEQQQYSVQHPEAEAAAVDVDVDVDVEVPPPVPPLIGHAAPAHINGHPNLEMPMIVAGFCFQSAVTMAAQSLKNDDMLCLSMVVAVAAICVSKYISTKFPVVARALDHVGVLSGATAFFIAVTASSPPCLKIITWIIFAISILAILVFNCHY